ncbi:MAG: apolipoprotein N-acyltransferase [Candidatus Zixiibacteriota bacterium]
MPKIFQYIAKSIWPDDLTLRQERLYLLFFAALLAAAWPPLPLGFLAVIALIKPLDIISGKSFRPAFKQGYFYFFFYHCFSLYWIGWVTIPGTIAAIGLISLYSAFMLALYSALYTKSKKVAFILLPFLWAGIEYFRTLLEIAFPWSNLSYTQSAYTAFIQICKYTGDAGITIILVIVNILLWQAWKYKKPLYVFIVGLLIGLPTIYGSIILSQTGPSDEGPIKVVVLQGSLSIEEKWNPDNRDYNFFLYDSLAVEAVINSSQSKPDLIVWPETAAPAYLLSEYRLTRMVAQTARKVETPMLVGTLDYTRLENDSIKTFNAAIHFNADGSHDEPYHKNKLVPFAETVPYSEYVPWLANLSLGWSDFEHGRELPIYESDFGGYGVLICYEVIFPELVNQYVRNGADFLVNITNDTWYGRSSGPYQHAGMAVFRAIENDIYIARAANSGFSYFVDNFGRIYNKSNLYKKTIVHGRLKPVKELTVFNKTGPLLGQFGLLLIGLLSIILFGLWIKEKTSA